MIYQFIAEDNIQTTDHFVRDWAPALKNDFHLITIQQVQMLEHLPVGTFICSDIERMSLEQRGILAHVYDQLAAFGPTMRLLNHPLRAKNRFELLNALYLNGTNTFRIFRVSDAPADLQFPVFVRVEKHHRGCLGGLIQSWKELGDKLVKLAMEGWSFDQLVLVEFCDTSDAEGTFIKYSAYRVGDRIVPRSMSFSTEWEVKGRDSGPVWRIEPKAEYVRGNPHAKQIMKVFHAANIEYGRIDYSLKGDKIVVWEINTSPHFANSKPEWYFEDRRSLHQFCADSLADAFRAINTPTSKERVPIKICWPEFESRTLASQQSSID